MGERVVEPSKEHEVAYQDIVAMMSKHGDKVSAEDLLAISANAVGKILAMQDQRTMTPERGMKIIARNIESGNAQMLSEVLGHAAGMA